MTITHRPNGDTIRALLAAAEDGPFMPNYDRMDEMVKFHGLSFDPA